MSYPDPMAARPRPGTRPRLPPPVRPGDRIGVAALSGPVDAARLARGLAALRELGFEPVPADNLEHTAEQGLFAGSDEERLAAFHRLAADPSLAAVIFARGGHGMLRLLPGIDWDLLARWPRAYVGYSDLTPFLLEVVRRLGRVAFHGPMVAADFARGLTAIERRSFLDTLAGRMSQELPLAGSLCRGTAEGGETQGGETQGGGTQGGEGGATEEGPTEPVEGPLLGGCLSLLTSTLGTPWAPDLEGALLFWEDIDEPLYRLDRMLSQHVLADRLSGIRAMIVGHADPSCGDDDRQTHLVTWLRDGPAGRLGCPVAWGLEAGHRAPNRTLPLGWGARLEPQRRRLVVLPHSA